MARPKSLKARDRSLDLSTPAIMGVLNITPDSFSDGGRFARHAQIDVDGVFEAACAMLAAGADILDIGGESTRPGAQAVSVERELERVIPVMERLRTLDTLLSVDTRKADVAEAALKAGCHMVNDVSAGGDAHMFDVVARSGAALCVMHMQGQPDTMQNAPHYEDPVGEVRAFLAERVQAALEAGVPLQSLVLDPGIGFGKAQEHNLALVANLEALRVHELPILLGASRKTVVGRITGRDVEQRLAGSIAMALMAVECGADIVRVHDVAQTKDALRVRQALAGYRS